MTDDRVITLDLNRLERVRTHGEKVIARCPACSEHGGDRSGRHLVLLPNGRFACAAHPGDAEHRRRIFSLVGIERDRTCDAMRDRGWREQRDNARLRERKRQAIEKTVTNVRAAIFERFAWGWADLWESSPLRLEASDADNPVDFLAALFSPESIIWTGAVWQSGERYAGRWRTVQEWRLLDPRCVGPMVSPCTWKPNSLNRVRRNIESVPFVVLDFDGNQDRPLGDRSEIERYHVECLAVIRWLRDGLRWRLAAILDTGSKSLHAWFRDPGRVALESLRDASRAFGIDAGLIGHPEHPCRLPGQRHEKTGRFSRVIWLEDIQNEPSLQP